MKKLQDGSMVAKERLVLNIINYIAELDTRFETSSVSKKNALLLLMFYLHIACVDRLDFVFRIVRLWRIPEEDLKIFMDDWAIIHGKIAAGLAHELSEGDTLYLAACTKGTKGGADKKPQPNSPVLADQRAYSIKAAYMNHVIVFLLCSPLRKQCGLLAEQWECIESNGASSRTVLQRTLRISLASFH